MFGILKHAGCVMAADERQQWTGHVCGLCLTLKKQYGQFARLATNYDAALLSALCQAQVQNSRIIYNTTSAGCLLRRPFRAEVITPENPGMQYAASMALIMAASKIKDHLQDNETGLRHIRRIASTVSNRWMRAAGKTAVTLGFSAQRIERQVQRQTTVEARPNQNFFFYAEPTELAVGAAFAHTAMLTDQLGNRDTLRRMGQMFGRIMYLLDSYQDYGDDAEANRFNALAASYAATDWCSKAVNIFQQAYSELEEYFQRLDLPQPALISALLLRKLKQKGCSTLHICKQLPDSCRLSGMQTDSATSSGVFAASQQEETEQLSQKQKRECCDGGNCFDCCNICDCACNCCDCGDSAADSACSCCDCCAVGDCCSC